jgi:SRSO17 transposase
VRARRPRDYFHGKWLEPEEWLLIEWPEDKAEPSHYWLSTLPADIAMQAFVRTAKLRWRIELDYRQLKDELGLDYFEGRRSPGWQRHVTLVSVAYHFLVRQQLRVNKACPSLGSAGTCSAS